MNLYKIIVANTFISVLADEPHTALCETGLFKEIENISHFLTVDRTELAIYKVKLNNAYQVAIVEKVD